MELDCVHKSAHRRVTRQRSSSSISHFQVRHFPAVHFQATLPTANW